MESQIDRIKDWLEKQWNATAYGADNEHPEERAYRNGMGTAYYKTLMHILDIQKEDSQNAAE